MEGIKVTLKPNIEVDHQTFKFDELGITHEDWLEMSEDEQHWFIYVEITENICSAIDDVEEFE